MVYGIVVKGIPRETHVMFEHKTESSEWISHVKGTGCTNDTGKTKHSVSDVHQESNETTVQARKTVGAEDREVEADTPTWGLDGFGFEFRGKLLMDFEQDSDMIWPTFQRDLSGFCAAKG